jgi:hypothetical protein
MARLKNEYYSRACSPNIGHTMKKNIVLLGYKYATSWGNVSLLTMGNLIRNHLFAIRNNIIDPAFKNYIASSGQKWQSGPMEHI